MPAQADSNATPSPAIRSSLIMPPHLELSHLQHSYGPHWILRDIDLCLGAGEFVALIGANGSGKTTLLKCIAGLVSVPAGVVRVGGIDMALDPAGAKSRLGFSVDPARLPPLLTGNECLRLFAEARDIAKIPDHSLALAHALGLTAMLDRAVAEYSLGTRQKLGIVLGLLGEPPLLVLDEPLNGLDPMSAFTFKQHLQRLTRERGTTVLLATHSLHIAERFINRAVLLMEGRIVRAWTPQELTDIREDPRRSLEQEMVRALQAG